MLYFQWTVVMVVLNLQFKPHVSPGKCPYQHLLLKLFEKCMSEIWAGSQFKFFPLAPFTLAAPLLLKNKKFVQSILFPIPRICVQLLKLHQRAVWCHMFCPGLKGNFNCNYVQIHCSLSAEFLLVVYNQSEPSWAQGEIPTPSTFWTCCHGP